MTDFKKIFLDTSPIVYYLENNELYYSKMKRFWKMYDECDYITSTVTWILVNEFCRYILRYVILMDSCFSLLIRLSKYRESQCMGHKSSQVTNDVYNHISQERSTEEVLRMAKNQQKQA